MREMSGLARRLTAVAALMLIPLAGNALRAQQQADSPPTEPILRLNTTAHTAPIQGIATDRENRYVASASSDKTARVWSLADNRLLNVLRVPIGEGYMGDLYAVAMTPDGATVALGGWTGVMGAEKNIFLLDRASGALQRRLSGLPDVVLHLAYSADGRFLVAALGGSNGIRVYDASHEYEPLPSDTTYGARANWADFDRQGRLATTSDDGFVRLYAAGKYDTAIAKVKAPGVIDPFSAVFSPDGQRVAVGDYDSTAIDLLSGEDLALIQAVDTTGVTVSDWSTTGWSTDGRYLFAGGRGGLKVRRWEGSGSGSHVDLYPSNGAVTELLPLKDGSVLFAAWDPAFGIIDREGHATTLQGPGQLVFWNNLGSLRVSKSGKIVEQGTSFPPHTVRFALAERRLDINTLADETLAAPMTEANGFKVTSWRNDYHPAVNGTPLKLGSYEQSRCLVILQGNDGFVLGTVWSLRRYDRAGILVWRKPVPGIAGGVNATPDGRLVVSAQGDGTIRWWRASDGQELLALFVHPDRKRWIAWTPQGYFDASVGADELIGWHVNHGLDQAPDFFPVSRFRDRFYRPDVIAKVLDTLDVDEALHQADATAGRMTPKAAALTTILPPIVKIEEPPQWTNVAETKFTITYSVRTPPDDPVTRVEAQIDSRKTEGKERVLAAGADARAGIITIELPRRDATVSVIAYNKHGASEPASVQVSWAGHGSEPKPKLYILAIGVGTYHEKKVKQLRYPEKDAEDFIRIVKDHSAGLYETVIENPPPSGGEWTQAAVLDALDWIKNQPTNKDVAIVFISGHGVVTPDQVYRFLPSNYDPDKIERTTVRSVDFQDFLSKVAGGKVLVFLDTCYSGDVLPGSRAPLRASQDKFANELADAKNGVVVFASSTGDQLSWEDPKPAEPEPKRG